jgi:hypothetical protein
LVNRLGRNGLGRFAELIICGSLGEVAGDHVVLGLDRCLFFADQLAGDERADIWETAPRDPDLSTSGSTRFCANGARNGHQRCA